MSSRITTSRRQQPDRQHTLTLIRLPLISKTPGRADYYNPDEGAQVSDLASEASRSRWTSSISAPMAETYLTRDTIGLTIVTAHESLMFWFDMSLGWPSLQEFAWIWKGL
jgi:hypothetical protein